MKIRLFRYHGEMFVLGCVKMEERLLKVTL